MLFSTIVISFLSLGALAEEITFQYNFDSKGFVPLGSQFSTSTDQTLVGQQESVEISSSQNDYLKFCRNRETIRVPVYSDSTKVTIPCSTAYGPQLDAKDILLYKGSPDTTLNLISGRTDNGNSTNTLQYHPDHGFLYQVDGKNWENGHLEKFTCAFVNSSKHNYVVTELIKNDYFVNLYPKPEEACDLRLYANGRKISFLCEVQKDLFENEFQWVFRTSDDVEIPVLNARRKPHRTNSFIGEELRLNFSSSKINGLECRVRKKNSAEWLISSFPVVVKDMQAPIVLDSSKKTVYEDKPGLELTCAFEAEPTWATNLVWLKNGNAVEYVSQTTNYVQPIATFTLNEVDATRDMDNYTCVVSNAVGSASRSFLVVRVESGDLAKMAIPLLYAAAAIIVVLSSLLWCTMRKFLQRRSQVEMLTKQPNFLQSSNISCGSGSFLMESREYGKMYRSTVILIPKGDGDKIDKPLKFTTIKEISNIMDSKPTLVLHEGGKSCVNAACYLGDEIVSQNLNHNI